MHALNSLCVSTRQSSGEMTRLQFVLMYNNWSRSSYQLVKIFRCRHADVSICILIIGTYLSYKIRISTKLLSIHGFTQQDRTYRRFRRR